jgi:hypothetical protein
MLSAIESDEANKPAIQLEQFAVADTMRGLGDFQSL